MGSPCQCHRRFRALKKKSSATRVQPFIQDSLSSPGIQTTALQFVGFLVRSQQRCQLYFNSCTFLERYLKCTLRYCENENFIFDPIVVVGCTVVQWLVLLPLSKNMISLIPDSPSPWVCVGVCSCVLQFSPSVQ